MKKLELITHDEFKDRVYGKRGTKRREEYEKGFQKFYKEVLTEIEKEEKIKAKKRRLSSSNTNRTTTRP